MFQPTSTKLDCQFLLTDILGVLFSQLAFRRSIFWTASSEDRFWSAVLRSAGYLSCSSQTAFSLAFSQSKAQFDSDGWMSSDGRMSFDGQMSCDGRTSSVSAVCLLNVFFAFPFSQQCYSLKRLKVYNVLKVWGPAVLFYTPADIATCL